MMYAVVGSRNFVNYGIVCSILDEYTDITHIVSGGARGADYLGKKYAEEKNLEYIEFPAEWDKYGRSAGFIRNKDIVNNSDIIIAFWDGISKGTENTINYARKQKKEVRIILI